MNPVETIQQAVVVAHGPASVTKQAITRLEETLGPEARIVVVAAVRPALNVVSRIKGRDVVAVREFGRRGYSRALASCAPGPVLLIHDDVVVDGPSISLLAADSAASEGVAVARLDGTGDAEPIRRSMLLACAVGERDDLAGLAGAYPTLPGHLVPVAGVLSRASATRSGGSEARLGRPEGPERRPLLVANLIVRDEEAMLPGCLESLAGLVDRVEITDTGSTDRTIEIARRAGATVEERSWSDDFSAARNHVLERTRDAWFVLWIDADERIRCEEPSRVRRFLAAVAGDVPGFEVEIHNEAGDGSVRDTFGAVRVFSSAGTSLAGVIHEAVVDAAGAPLHGPELPGLSIRHLGYGTESAAPEDKALRNLELARRRHADSPDAASALELARAELLADGDPRRALELLADADAGAEDQQAPLRAHIKAIRGRVELQLGDREEALASAGTALELVPADDLAAAVFAESALDLGRTAELVTLARHLATAESAKPAFSSDANRARFRGLVAAALAAEGEVAAALSEVGAIQQRTGSYEFWDRLIPAVVGCVGAEDAVTALVPVVSPDFEGRFLGPAASALPPSGTAALCIGYLDAGGAATDVVAAGLLAAIVADDEEAVRALAAHAFLLDPSTLETVAARADDRGRPRLAGMIREAGFTGGTRDAGAASLDTGRIATLVPPGRRVLDEGSVLTGPLLGRDSHLSTDPGEGPFDVVIAGTSAELAGLGDLVAPGGMVVSWSEDAVGVAGGAGGTLSVVGRVVLWRPPWSAEAVAAALEDPDEFDLAVMTEEPIPEELKVAYRLSLPLGIGAGFVSRAEVGDLPSDTPVLVTDPAIVAEPAWVQALWDGLQETGQPVGVRLCAPDGSLIHAGGDTKGAPFGFGSPSAHELFSSDRPDATLALPWMGRAGDLVGDAEPVRGRYLGSAAAVGGVAAPGEGSARLPDVFPATVLVISAEGGRASLQLVRGMSEAGFTPVVADPAIPDLEAHSMRRAGAIVVRTLSGMPGRSPAALAGALAPRAVVYADPAALRDDYPVVSAAHPTCWSIAGFEPDPELAERVDEVVALDDPEAVAAVAARADRPIALREASPAPIGRRGTTPGLVSVVIPVWNKWELTAACLDSLEDHAEAPLEVLVVDNGSTDETAARLAERAGVAVITNDENLGFPRAVNQGIDAATGEFVCILNNDTEVTVGWLEEMLSVLATSGTAMVGPRTNRISGLQAVPGAPDMTDADAARRWASTWHATRRGSWLINRLVGFCLLARRSLFEEQGGFDEGFGIGNYEDDELCARVRASGLELRVADRAVVLHHGSATFDELDADYAALLGRAARAHGGGRPGSGLVTAVVLSDGDSEGALLTAHDALAVADRVRVVERIGGAVTELHTGALAQSSVEVVHRDWGEESGASAAIEGIRDRMVMVCAAGERLEIEDCGRVRSGIEDLPAGPVVVATDHGPEVRLHPPTAAAVAAMGSPEGARLPGLRVIS